MRKDDVCESSFYKNKNGMFQKYNKMNVQICVKTYLKHSACFLLISWLFKTMTAGREYIIIVIEIAMPPVIEEHNYNNKYNAQAILQTLIIIKQFINSLIYSDVQVIFILLKNKMPSKFLIFK